jgi:uncharacterized coiled-coil protein SlyX
MALPNKDYRHTIAEQAVIISKNQETIATQQSTITRLKEIIVNSDKKRMAVEKHNDGQRYLIAKLNNEREQAVREIKEKDQIIIQLTKENHSLSKNGGSENESILRQYKELLNEFKDTKKRKLDDA